MNQHASRPVAQAFPLHRRINGPGIQSSCTTGPSRMTPLQPSNPSTVTTTNHGGPLRRSLGFKSQIPIRIDFGDQQNLLRARVLERHRQSLLSTSQSSAAATAATLQAVRTSSSSSSSSSAGLQQPIDTAFKVYEDRLHTDLRDFRAICSRLILQEQEEKEKWHTLCLKMMKERDMARQRVSALISERETHWSSSSSSSSAVPPSGSAKENVPTKTSKRARDETSSAAQELVDTQEPPSRSSPMKLRPIRSLRLSPISSPPGSPSTSLSTNINSSSLPSTSTESPPPPSSTATVPPTSTTSSTTPCSSDSSSVTPLNIMTFNPARSPNDKTCFDVFGEFDIPETRPVKRRKSYDSTPLSSDQKTVQTGTETCRNAKYDGPAPPFSIGHTDIMYMPMKGRLYCRACLLDKTLNPSSSSSSRNPKTFPTTVYWDELRDHCVSEHPTACADVARLSPDELNEVRRRLYNV